MAKAKKAKANKSPDEPAMFTEDELMPAPTPTVQTGFDIWNEFAEKNKWSKAEVLDSGRRSAMKRAIKDYGGLIGFRRNLEKITRSDFCMGRVPGRNGQAPFKAHVDWFMRPATVRQVIENFYNRFEKDTPIAVPAAGSSSTMPDGMPKRPWRTILERYKPRGFWAGSDGPRPEDPGCKVPAEFLDPWRKKHGITGVRGQASAETEAEKLAASIQSYRKIGRYDDANRLEQKLADLQSRPATLVPAPDVAHLGMGRPAATPRPQPSTPPIDVEEIPPWDGVPEGPDYGGDHESA